MKKPNFRQLELSKERYLRYLKKCIRNAHKKKNKKIQKSLKAKNIVGDLSPERELHLLKNQYIRNLYKRRFQQKQQIIKIEGHFGIEAESSLDYFFKKANEILSSHSREIIIDLSLVERIWPSAITFLCSFSHYAKLISMRTKHRPKIKSIHPNNEVGEYLRKCGFNSYVGIERPKNTLPSTEIVPIKRENDNKNVAEREEQIVTLIREHSDFTEDEIEEFDSIILTEIFNNVTEHGITIFDRGWWVLAQYHKKHKMINICISDNGIGIRKSLTFGPQRNRILDKLSDEANNEGEFIRKAAEEINISGASNASISHKRQILGVFPAGNRYSRGARRGRGLKRIRKSCIRLGISLTIISRSGFYQKFPDSNSESTARSFDSDIFAGTLYHLMIPTERKGEYQHD